MKGLLEYLEWTESYVDLPKEITKENVNMIIHHNDASNFELPCTFLGTAIILKRYDLMKELIELGANVHMCYLPNIKDEKAREILIKAGAFE